MIPSLLMVGCLIDGFSELYYCSNGVSSLKKLLVARWSAVASHTCPFTRDLRVAVVCCYWLSEPWVMLDQGCFWCHSCLLFLYLSKTGSLGECPTRSCYWTVCLMNNLSEGKDLIDASRTSAKPTVFLTRLLFTRVIPHTQNDGHKRLGCYWY